MDPRRLERLEGGVLVALSLLGYWKHSGSWVLFVLLILAPDLFMIGYVRGPRLGAATYNLGHTWLLPGLIVALGLIAGFRLSIDVGLIWFAHIGLDRALGYGLKLPTDFKDTHLGRIGRSRRS